MISTLKTQLSMRALKQAIAAVGVVYVLLGAYTLFNAKNMISSMEENLSSYSIPLATLEDMAPISMPNQHRDNSKNIVEKKMGANTVGKIKIVPAPAGAALTPAPIEGFYRETPNKEKLPIVSSKGQKPFDAYKRPFVLADKDRGKPIIALGLAGFGLSGQVSQTALEYLPAEVSFIVSPYSPDLNEIQTKARASGHEVWLNVSFENEFYPEHDLGPQVLMKRSSMQYNNDRLEWHLARTVGYAGIASYTDDLFSSISPMVQGVFKNLYQRRGLGFLELNPKAPGMIEGLSISYDGEYIKNNRSLNQDPRDLQKSFSALEDRAVKHGIVIAVIRAQPKTILDTAKWIAELRHKGFVIAPISAAADIIPND